MLFKKTYLATTLSIATLLLSGCAMTVDPVYQPQLTAKLHSNTAMTLQTQDSRGVNPTILVNIHDIAVVSSVLTGGAGMRNSDFKLSEPLASYINHALTTAFTQAGYKTGPSHNILLIDIVKTSGSTNSETNVAATFGIKDPTVTFRMLVHIQVKAKNSSKILYETTLKIVSTGQHQSSGMSFTPKASMMEAFPHAIDNLANQIIANDALNKALG